MAVIYTQNNSYTERCYIIIFNDNITLNTLDKIKLRTLLTLLMSKEYVYSYTSFFNINDTLTHIGPRFNFPTSWSSNAIQILRKCNITEIKNIEYVDTYNYSIQYDKMTHAQYTNIESFITEFSNTNTNTNTNTDTSIYVVIDIEAENIKQYLNMSPIDINYYKKIKNGTNFTNIELFDLAQCNSEHSRHWLFNGRFYINNIPDEQSLFQKIKDTNILSPNNSVIAFSDNASAITGFNVLQLVPSNNRNYKLIQNSICLTSNAETHNFPTGICPFPGASTGTGGRIRDTISIGRGGKFLSGFIGYSVGNLFLDNKAHHNCFVKYPYVSPTELLIQASNGASDYGNKIGEPILCGFTRSFGEMDTIRNIHYEWIKPILYSAGNGYIYNTHLHKYQPKEGNLVVRVGGPAYNVGLGGGSASSRNQNEVNKDFDFNAVQRGDPEMENRLCRFVEACTILDTNNPILSIHDQGSGGMANVTKEIIFPLGADIYLQNVNIGDNTINSFNIWNAEYQEQCTILIDPSNIDLCINIATRESVPLNVVGTINNSNNIRVFSNNNNVIVDLNLNDIMQDIPRKEYYTHKYEPTLFINYKDLNLNALLFETYIHNVFSLVSVGSKQFLTSKVDRSVTGLVAQQQCIGPWQLPLSNYSINAISYYNTCGIVSSIGEQPLKGIYNMKSMVSMSIGEMLTNMIFAVVDDYSNIKCQVNWMWSAKIEPYDYLLYDAVSILTNIFKTLKIGIDGGKDSLTMNTIIHDNIIFSPNTCVVKSYAPTTNIYNKITPEFKCSGNILIHIDFAYNKRRIGGSSLLQTLNKITTYNDSPIFEDNAIHNFPLIFKIIQQGITNGIIVSGHDISDGGLITTIIEMSIASKYGVNININNTDHNLIDYFFSEELGIIIELQGSYLSMLEQLVRLVPCIHIGRITNDNTININYNNENVLCDTRNNLLDKWSNTSYLCDLLQTNKQCVDEEYTKRDILNVPKYNIISTSIGTTAHYLNINSINDNRNGKIVAIIREEGSNGDKEMAAAFYCAGFSVYDISTTDLLNSNGSILDECNGIAFVGGFSYSDVFGSANGWYNVLVSNDTINHKLNTFFNKQTTFSMGICNGCQLLSLFNILPKCNIFTNTSNRFESRYVNIVIKNNNDNTNIFTNNMHNVMCGMHSAHGEGRIVLDNPQDAKYACLFYANNNGIPTEQYPYNPNGSKGGIAGLVSKNGRHIGLMPHPERCFLDWQLSWKPHNNNKSNNNYSIWFNLFTNCNN